MRDDQAIIEKYREDVLSGRTFTLHAMSARSIRGYQPPISRRDWAFAIETLAKMAASSDRLAQVAANIIGRVNLYGDKGQAMAAIYERAEEALSKGYTDVIGRAGPETGRPSSYEHEFTLYDRVALMYWLELACRPLASKAPGVGWCLAALAEEVHFYPTPPMSTRRAA